MSSKDAKQTLLLELNRSMYILIRIALRPFLGKKKRDNLLERIWSSSYDLPKPILSLMPNFVRKKWNLYYSYASWVITMQDKTWEPNVMNYLTSIRGKLFVNVGANLGVCCAKLQKNFERIIAIEADPDICKELRKRSPSNCKAINLAVSNIEGYVDFHTATLEDNPTIGTMFPAITEEQGFKPASKVIRVRAAPLSRVLANEGDVDLVKVDVEGAEWLVLEGAEPILPKIKRWVIELHEPSRKAELEARMKRYGYKRFEWLDSTHVAFHRTNVNVET